MGAVCIKPSQHAKRGISATKIANCVVSDTTKSLKQFQRSIVQEKKQSQRCKASTQVHSTSSRASGARKLLWIPQPISFLTGISPSPSLLLPHHSSPSSCLLLVVLSTSSRSAPSRPPLAMCVSPSFSSQLPLTLAQASKVAVLGAAGGIGQPLSLLLKLNPRVSNLALYDIRGGPGKLDFNWVYSSMTANVFQVLPLI